ncbi:MAG TPA: phosphatase PAP2 family protein [Thermoanaerobaculia bacterium]
MIFIAGFVAIFLLFWLIVSAVGPLYERALKRAANWTASFRYRDYLPVFLLLAAGVAATMLAGDVFIDIAERVQAESSQLHQIDGEVHAWARETRTGGATTFFTIMTVIGTPVGLACIICAMTFYLALQKRWRWAGYLFFTGGVGGLLNLWLKSTFARARPELAEALRDAHGYSFPSGHAMGSTIVFGALSYLAFRIFKTWRVRAIAVAFTISMIVAIAASRIYLGVHWISDIGGGISAGIVWLAATTVAYEAFRRIRLVRALRAKAVPAQEEAASSLRTSRGE